MTENKLCDPHKSSLGMDANKPVIIFWLVASVLMFIPFGGVLSFVCPLVFLIMEKESAFVRFHAWQCMIYSIILGIINIPICILTVLPLAVDTAQQTAEVRYCPIIKVDFLPYLLGIVMLVLGILVIVKANSYEAYKLPIAGPIAEKKAFAED